MHYVALIYGNEAAYAAMSEAERNADMAAYGTFTEMVQKKGILHAGEALQPVSTATTIRVRDGKTITTDGPFAETKEQLGGFYLLECKDLDEAIGLAAQIPGAAYGSVEIRPIVVWE